MHIHSKIHIQTVMGRKNKTVLMIIMLITATDRRVHHYKLCKSVDFYKLASNSYFYLVQLSFSYL